MEPDGAIVVARDARGRPALLERRVGEGRLVLCTYPLEHMAALSMGVNPEPTWRLYSALAEIAGVLPDVRVNDPRVIVGEMRHEDGRRYVWFVSESEQAVRCVPVVARGRLLGLDGTELEGAFELPPFGVWVVEWVEWVE